MCSVGGHPGPGLRNTDLNGSVNNILFDLFIVPSNIMLYNAGSMLHFVSFTIQ